MKLARETEVDGFFWTNRIMHIQKRMHPSPEVQETIGLAAVLNV